MSANKKFLKKVRKGKLVEVQTLVKNGFDPRPIASKAIKLAIKHNHVPILQYFTSIGLDVLNKDNKSLYRAVKYNRLESVKYLYEHNTNVNLDSLIQYASAFKNDKIKEYLRSKNVQIPHPETMGVALPRLPRSVSISSQLVDLIKLEVQSQLNPITILQQQNHSLEQENARLRFQMSQNDANVMDYLSDTSHPEMLDVALPRQSKAVHNGIPPLEPVRSQTLKDIENGPCLPPVRSAYNQQELEKIRRLRSKG